jgi:hypothetical protein
LFILFEIFLLFYVTLKFGFFFILCAIFIYVTVLIFRRSELSGIDTFNFLRNNLTIFNGVKKTYANNGKDLQEASKDDRFIFVIMSNMTNIPLISAFGFHGDPILKNLNICYMLPTIFFYVPILREILLLSGAVSTTAAVDDMDRIQEMLRLGRSVVYAPNGMEDILYINEDEENGEYSKDHPKQPPPIVIFDLVISKNIKIVPCVVIGEEKKYLFWTSPLLKKVQKYFLSIIKYPFPLVIFPKRNVENISILFGYPARGKSKDELSKNFHEQVQQLQNNF